MQLSMRSRPFMAAYLYSSTAVLWIYLTATAAAGAVAAGCTQFEPIWKHQLTQKMQPLSLAAATNNGVVVVGARNCPTNSENQATYLNISDGSEIARGPSISEIGFGGRDANEMSITGVGWNKQTETIVIAQERGIPAKENKKQQKEDSVGWTNTIRGETAMWGSVATSQDGRITAVFVESEPEQSSSTNRSALLQLFSSEKDPIYTWTAHGMQATDPTTVAIAGPARQDTTGTRYTVFVLYGTEIVGIDFDIANHSGHVAYRATNGGEVAVAVGPGGNFFAVGNGDEVDLYVRNDRGKFTSMDVKIRMPNATMHPGQEPETIRIVEGHQGPRSSGVNDFLVAVAWNTEDGTCVGVTAHKLTLKSNNANLFKAQLNPIWGQVMLCSDDNHYDDVVNTGLSVSDGGEWLSLGHWGCGTSDNLHVWRGFSGDAAPVLSTYIPGQIWAVDIGNDRLNSHVDVVAGVWGKPGQASEVVAFRASQPECLQDTRQYL